MILTIYNYLEFKQKGIIEMQKKINVAIDERRNTLLDQIVEKRKVEGSLIKSKLAVLAEAIELMHKREVK